MKHTMRLNTDFFEKIQQGQKTIEVRILDEKKEKKSKKETKYFFLKEIQIEVVLYILEILYTLILFLKYYKKQNQKNSGFPNTQHLKNTKNICIHSILNKKKSVWCYYDMF